MVEAVVRDEWKASIDEGQRLRGWISNAFAQIEFVLGDIIVRSFEMAEYNDLPRTMPHGAPDRVKRVRRIMGISGFFDQYCAELRSLLCEFEKKQQIRNLLAHGFCQFLHTKSGDCGLQFRKWHRSPGRQDACLVQTFRITDLEQERDELVPLSSSAVSLLFRIHEELGLVVPT